MKSRARLFLPLVLVLSAGTAAALRPAATQQQEPSRRRCDASYPYYCIPPPPPDLDCPDITGKKPFRVRQPDPHGFDRDRDGWACEPPRPRRRT